MILHGDLISAFFENVERISTLHEKRREEALTADECFLARWRMKNDTDDPEDVVSEINERRKESDSSIDAEVNELDVMFHLNHRCDCDHLGKSQIKLRDCMRLRTMELDEAIDHFPNHWEYTIRAHWEGKDKHCIHEDLIEPRTQ
ncbi:hypothetical protein [Halococcus sp. IIIV-5B]|uniref:hypothetical protein n=1 Tax=Halococcus sp. IIIV-5B TaxID=2321230 RepID=UPI000E70A297|nr:hypothetical protein [Halococcus sp. IIIV-5B]RJT03894.1 hypothetical protein D3261_10680 [Halococcus sp. IIIV-5B]